MMLRTLCVAALLAFASTAAATPQNSSPSTSPLPLVLIGVVPGTGQALIWNAVKEEYQLLRVGENCQNYQLRRLLKDRVILTQGESSLVLPLDGTPIVGPGEHRRETGEVPASLHTARERNNTTILATNMVDVQSKDQRSPAASIPPEALSSLDSSLDSSPPGTQGEEVASPIKLGEGVQVISLLSLRKEVSVFLQGLSPYNASYFPSGGILVQGIKAGTMLHTLGLEEGDVIIAIGGIQVSSKEEAINAYLSFTPEKEVELQLLRQGAPRTLSFRLSA